MVRAHVRVLVRVLVLVKAGTVDEGNTGVGVVVAWSGIHPSKLSCEAVELQHG